MDSIQARTLAHRAFSKGYIVVFDIKDGLKVEADDQFVRTNEAFSFCREALFGHYANEPDDEDPEGRSLREIESADELELGFQEVSSQYMFFVLSGRFDSVGLDEVLAACRERCFFAPWQVIRKGKIVFSAE
ncbi:hypothetical protein [Halomonas alkaliantarctica]|uniref:hypothetical protein n=1 Tax=Halomonas alkaliantarctica TaxID=232346 RepID=UPI002658D875|nr:hypothetical protein [Halomonas alkaliantarctica]